MWIYLLGKYLGVEWLGHRVGVYLKLRLPKVVQNLLYHFIPRAVYENSTAPNSCPKSVF